jgi:hypothetical protein
MRMSLAIILAGGCIFTSSLALSRESGQETRLAQAKDCPLVVHCGIKISGKKKEMKQYPTKCAAEADGATNIVRMEGSKCPIIE